MSLRPSELIGMSVAVNVNDVDQRTGVVYDTDGDTLLVSCGKDIFRVQPSVWRKWPSYKVRVELP